MLLCLTYSFLSGHEGIVYVLGNKIYTLYYHRIKGYEVKSQITKIPNSKEVQNGKSII